MNKKIAACVLCLLLLVFATAQAGDGLIEHKTYQPIASLTKDETIYISLLSDGSVKEIHVVNRLKVPLTGEYTDYGTYDTVTNLTNAAAPAITEGKVSWKLTADGKGFYYQGSLKDAEPPFLFSVHYLIDGAETPAADMAGKSGTVTLRVDVRPNTAAKAYFRENYFCQFQAELDLDTCRDVSAPGSTSVITGRTQTLAYTVLPGKSATFQITCQATDFALNGFTITSMPYAVSNVLDMDTGAIKDDVAKMKDGTQQLVDGAKALQDGLSTLSDGVSKLSSGAKDAKSGLSEYKNGLAQYTGGVTQLSAQAAQISQGLDALAANGESLKTGYAQMKTGIEGLLAVLEPTATPDMMVQIATLKGQLAAYGAGLDDYIDGVSGIAQGMKSFSQGIAQLESSGQPLLPGLQEILNGMGQLTGGLSKTASEMKKLPDEVGKLVDGQVALKDGIDEAAKLFDTLDLGNQDAAPVSFVSDKVTPRSVQFIYRTESVGVEEPKADAPAETQAKKGLIEKIKGLVR